MSTMFNPKLEVFKIKLQSQKSPSFQRLFSSTIYEDDSIVFLDSFKKFITEIDKQAFYKDDKRKKAFTAYDTTKTEHTDASIVPHGEKCIIEGTIEGGKWGKKRKKSTIGDKNSKEDFNEDDIIIDKFYFFIHTPLDSDIGILMMQSYASDSVTDIFSKFLSDFYSHSQREFKPSKIERFYPKNIIDEFEQDSEVKKFTFSTNILVANIGSGDIGEKGHSFSVKIEAIADENIKRSELSKWLGTLTGGIVEIGKTKKAIKDFEKGKVYLQNSKTKKQSPFEIAKNFQIKPVIYLNDKVDIDKNGNINYKQLKTYCMQLLDSIKPEVYPIKKIREH